MPRLDLLVLFGSTVKGRRRAGSDLDLAVRFDGPADLDALYPALAGRLGTDQFQSLASRRYCDTAKLRAAQQRAIRVFLEREGLA